MKRRNISALKLTLVFFFGLSLQITELKDGFTERFVLSLSSVFAAGDEELGGTGGSTPTCRSQCTIEQDFSCSFPSQDANGDPIIATCLNQKKN